MKSIETECSSCGGTGVYCGMCEAKGTGVVCIDCSGTGKDIIYYKPFTKKKGKKGVKEVYISGGKLITMAGSTGKSVPYVKFKKAITIQDVIDLFKMRKVKND